MKIKDLTPFLLRAHSRIDSLALQRKLNTFSGEPLQAIIPGVALNELWTTFDYADDSLSIVAVFVLIVSLLGMLAALYTTLNERRRELAIPRVLGMGPLKNSRSARLRIRIAEHRRMCVGCSARIWAFLRDAIAGRAALRPFPARHAPDSQVVQLPGGNPAGRAHSRSGPGRACLPDHIGGPFERPALGASVVDGIVFRGDCSVGSDLTLKSTSKSACTIIQSARKFFATHSNEPK
jgi:hypothetical protein